MVITIYKCDVCGKEYNYECIQKRRIVTHFNSQSQTGYRESMDICFFCWEKYSNALNEAAANFMKSTYWNTHRIKNNEVECGGYGTGGAGLDEPRLHTDTNKNQTKYKNKEG